MELSEIFTNSAHEIPCKNLNWVWIRPKLTFPVKELIIIVYKWKDFMLSLSSHRELSNEFASLSFYA